MSNDPQADAQAKAEAAAGDALCNHGRFAEAARRFSQALQHQSNDATLHYKLACAAWKSDQPESAERHLEEAVRLAPNYADAQDALAQWRLENGDFERAVIHSAIAARLAPRDHGIVGSHAHILATAGKTEAALALIDPLVAASSSHPRFILNFALMALKLGREREAADMLERALRMNRLPPAGERRLRFVAANLLDRLGRYDEAFGHARRANALVSPPHDPVANARRVDRVIEYFTPERIERLPRAVHGSRRPIFIVGMPRSGTSLVEQILASHPEVFGGGELMFFGDIVWNMPKSAWAQGRPFPDCLDLLTPELTDALGRRYLDAAASLNATARYVTDKMPANHWHLGLMQSLLPNCRVIHCARDPLDTCLSCHFTDFSLGNRFTADLRHLGAYLRDQDRLMEHWRRVLKLPILQVRYEDLVFNLEEQTHRLLDFLELPWDAKCLQFHENKRRVTTASKDQVRRPIYASSVGRWKNYERNLTPLIEALSVTSR